MVVDCDAARHCCQALISAHSWVCCEQGATNGDVYEGDYVDNAIDGNGRYTWANGCAYAGEWQEERQHGAGTYTWPDGSSYVGEWFDGYRQGQTHPLLKHTTTAAATVLSHPFLATGCEK